MRKKYRSTYHNTSTNQGMNALPTLFFGVNLIINITITWFLNRWVVWPTSSKCHQGEGHLWSVFPSLFHECKNNSSLRGPFPLSSSFFTGWNAGCVRPWRPRGWFEDRADGHFLHWPKPWVFKQGWAPGDYDNAMFLNRTKTRVVVDVCFWP